MSRMKGNQSMYEPIRNKSVHTPRPTPRPRPTPHDQLSEQLAGHIGALLTHTTALHRHTLRLAREQNNQHAAGGRSTPTPDRDEVAALLTDLESAQPLLTERVHALASREQRSRVWQGTPLPTTEETGEQTALPELLALHEQLHEQAHTLAGRALVVAASRQDTDTAILTCHRMDAHEKALRLLRRPAPPVPR